MKLYMARRGVLKIDGGAMFGIVPKVFWEKTYPSDENNCVDVSLWWTGLEWEGGLLLVDPGGGYQFRAPFEEELKPHEILEKWGKTPETVSHIFLTHLHLDHVEGLLDEQGKAFFPSAQVWVSRTCWEDAQNPHPFMGAAFPPSAWLQQLEKEYSLVLFEEDREALGPPFQILFTPGHTEGHASLCASLGEKHIYWAGDLIPMYLHMNLPYISSFDIEPKVTCDVKKKLFGQLASGDWILFPHEPSSPLAEWKGEKAELLEQVSQEVSLCLESGQ